MQHGLRFTAYLTFLLVAGSCVAQAAPPKTKAKDKPKATIQANVPAPEQLLKKLKPKHPRLLVDQAGFESLGERIKTDPALKEWDAQLQRDADKMLKAPLPRYEIPDGLRLLSMSRRVLHDSYTLALTFRLHGDRRYADRLWEEMKTVAAFPDFNPRHFLDTAEMTHALAIAYDWLYDTWTESQRATIREAIVRHGLKPGLKVYQSKGWWPKSIHNWNQVCNGGMTAGALAIADEEPQLAGQIVHDALASIPLAMNSYAPDGAWGEGPGYWNYATTYNVVMLAVLESALGSDFGLSKMAGFADTGLFPIYMLGPSGRLFNFEDSGDRLGRVDPMFWLAERFNRPVCTWFAANQGRPSAMAMVWYRKPGQDPAAAGLPLDKHWRGVEVATLLGRWNDPQAVFVGVQAGSNRVNHNHLDVGSFVLDALGERWAFDLGGDNYNLPGYFGRQRYTYYRLRAEGHNTLVINPGDKPDQDLKAEARISRFESRSDRAFAVADLTPAYAKDVKRAERGIALLDRRVVLVQDDVDVSQPVDLWWFMHTRAGITLGSDGRTATLQQGKGSLTAQLLGPPKARFEIRDAAPLPTSPKPEKQAANKNVRKLTIHLPETGSVRLGVLFTPVDGQAGTRQPLTLKPLAEW